MLKLIRRSGPAFSGGVCLLLSACITINLLPGPGPLHEEVLSGSGTPKVLLLEVSGLISDQDRDELIQEQPNLLAHVKEVLSRAGKDKHVKAIVLRINSPGGTVTASDVLYHEIKQFKEQHKIPVVASIMDVGASGGYYVSMAADKIVAHPSSVTGSIGVIMMTVNARGLLEKIGMEATAVTSGPKKDMGSPFRPMTDEERQIFQDVINAFYERFLKVVQEGRRNLTADQVRKLADGRIYSGEQAKAAGLVDSIGYLDDTVALAKQQAGLTEARVVTYRRPGEYRQNIYSRLSGADAGLTALATLNPMAMVRGGTPRFMYLWMP